MDSGFECEFVEKPTEVFQTECLICLSVLREPYQVICCGKSFCRSCIGHVRALRNPCPHCNEENFTDFPNKGLQQSLYQLKVRCTHQKEGCEWKGELGELDNHLNLDSQPASKLKGCGFVMIECTHCSESHQRQHINQHQTEVCPKRPFVCEHCKHYKSSFEDVTTNHWPVCERYPIPCPNKCGAVHWRQNSKRHVAKDCPLTVIECDLHYLGCEMKLPRKDMGEHLREEFKTHKTAMAVGHRQEIAKFQLRIDELEKENKTLKTLLQEANQQIDSHQTTKEQKRIEELVKQNEALQRRVNELEREQEKDKGFPLNVKQPEPLILPVDMTMIKFQQYKESNEAWYSPPFYTHHRGYKLCLRCDANGFSVAIGTHVSISFYMMRGEYDDELKWPLKCRIIIRLLHREKPNEHYTKTIALSVHAMTRVTEGDIGKQGTGMRHYVSHDNCYKQYIKNNSLHFGIVKVTMM